MSLFAIAWFLFWGGAWLLVSPHVWRIVFTFERVEAQIVGHGFKDGDALLTLKILQGQFQGKASWLAMPNTSTVGYPINGKLVVAINPKDPSISELPISKKEAAFSQVLLLLPFIFYFFL